MILFCLIAKDKNGKKLQFTNSVFNQGQIGSALKLQPFTTKHQIENKKGRIYGVHKSPWGYFTVGIIGTEKSLGGNEILKKEIDVDAAAKDFAS